MKPVRRLGGVDVFSNAQMTVKKKNNKGTQKQETQTELKNSLEEIRLDQEEEIRKLEDSKLLS